MTTVVLVDDHEALRDGLAALLSLRGLEVVGVAGNAAAAVDSVAAGAPDVALVDARLPDASGIELCRWLLDRHPGLGVILYAADPHPELVTCGIAAGARGHVLKAGSTAELVAAIEHVGQGGTYIDPRVDAMVRLSPSGTDGTPLSPREREVVHLMAEGQTAEQIGERFAVSTETVRSHVQSAVRKLRARNRVHAIALALARGEVALDDVLR